MSRMSSPGHELLDAGDGRRLERFGAVVVDRPAPGADGPRRDATAWAEADARFDRDGGGPGRWRLRADLPASWVVTLGGLDLELRFAAAGQVGAFPEHLPTWSWLRGALEAWGRRTGAAAEVLDLFAYTGGSTLACAGSGARLVHVDASRTAVSWARRNAGRSGLADRPIRWIVEDARPFVARETRRGRRYDGIILDPPTYGHGPEGRQWRIDRDLGPLLDAALGLRSSDPAFILLTAHSPGYSPEHLAGLLGPRVGADCESGPLELRGRSGARLVLGAYARWAAG